MAKSIWNMAYDSLSVSLKKNKKNLSGEIGYIFYYKKYDNKLYVWEYQIKKIKGNEINNKAHLKLIFSDEPKDINLVKIIDSYSTWKESGEHHKFPVFEMKTSHKFPMNETLIPIMKRKIMAYVFQIVNIEKIKNFDSEK